MKTTLELDLTYYKKAAEDLDRAGYRMAAHDLKALVAEVECLRKQVVKLEKELR
jgi:hypothetical protein